MINKEVDLAEVAYVAYHNTLGWRDMEGNPTPHFRDLSDKELECWDNVVTKILESTKSAPPQDSSIPAATKKKVGGTSNV